MCAIQLARVYKCAEVVVTSSQGETCTRLGATRVIDHRAGEKWDELLKGAGMDVVFNAVEGKEAFYNASKVLKPSGGRYITINADNPHKAPTPADFCAFMGAMTWRKSWSWLGYPSFEFHVSVEDPAGLQEAAKLAAAGALAMPLHAGVVHPMRVEAVREMWTVQMAGRVHGRSVFMWES